MANEVASGALQGAAAGAAVAGPIGAVFGGVIGAISGIFKKKANNKKKEATRIERQMYEREQAIQRRDMVRQMRVARAQAVAAGTDMGGLGSGVAGATSSVAAQGASNLRFFGNQISLGIRRNSLLDKAAKYDSTSATIGSLVQVGASAAGYAKAAGWFSGPSYTAASTGTQTFSTPSAGNITVAVPGIKKI